MEARKEALLSGIDDLRNRSELFAIKVAPLYLLLWWTWKDEPCPPSAKAIHNTLLRLLDSLEEAALDGRVNKKDGRTFSTGGLTVGYVGRGEFLMDFVVDERIYRDDWVLNTEGEYDS